MHTSLLELDEKDIIEKDRPMPVYMFSYITHILEEAMITLKTKTFESLFIYFNVT